MSKLKRKLSIAKCLLFFLVATGNCDDTKNVPKIDPEKYEDDGKLLLKFSCEAKLEIGDKLSWMMTRDTKEKKEEELKSHKESEKSNNFKLELEHHLKPEDNNAELVCVVDHKSGTKTPSKKVTIVFKSATSDDTKNVPKIDPEKYEDDGKLLLKFSCEAKLEIGDKLSWMMTRDTKEKKEEELKSHKESEKSNNFKLELEHHLKPEDNNAELVCVVDHKSGTKTPSKKVTIVFKSSTSDDTKNMPKITPEKYEDDGKLLLQFSCEANLEEGDSLSWSFTRKENETLSTKYVEVEKSKNVKYDLQYQLKEGDNDTELVCIKESKSGTKTHSNTVSIVFKPATKTEKPKINMDPVITPETYVDDGKPFLEFSCEAYLEKEDQLSWIITRNKVDETIALYKELEEGRTKILDLQYPLAQEDDQADIVCIKEYKNGNKVHSNNVSIVITEAKLPKTREKLFVWPKKTIIIYNDTTPVPLACWGWLDATNKEKDTSLYVTWYQIYGSTRPERITMLPQENTLGYVKLEMMKIFTPIIDDETKIYCATEQMSTTLKTTPELKSEEMTLMHFPSAPVCYPFDECRNVTSLGWAVAAVLVLLAVLTLVGLLVAIFSLCCRGDRKCENDTQESKK